MHSRILIPAALVLLSILGFFGWRLVQQREHQECAARSTGTHGQ
jgi:predicted negative regulator of RcsB-dependent stress response